MDCEQALSLVSSRIDHEIAVEENVLLDAHLSECATCRAALEAFQSQDAELRRAYTSCERSVAGVEERVAAHLPAVPRAGQPARSFMPNPMRSRFQRPLSWSLTAAVVLGAGLGLYKFTHQAQQGTQGYGSVAGLAGIGEEGCLTPSRRPEPPAAVPLVIGSSLKTGASERRRVSLPDGSILYLNQNTEVRLSADRHLHIAAGEVFVEVAPGALVKKEGDPTFIIDTAQRQVTALGTKFAVKVEPKGTGVVVTQGKVQVNGLSNPIQAGQQVKPGSNEVAAAPRASHVLDWTRDLVAAAESPLVPKSKHCGGALVAVDPYGQEARLGLVKYRVDVHIEDGFARTTIDQTYFNHNAWRLEGTFFFPLPADASLSRLAMYVSDGKECVLMEGGMAERDYARDVFEQIVTTQRDPALLEWLDGSTFKMRVFPLEGRQEKRIVLSYTQKLDTLYGHTGYRFPGGHNLPIVGEWSFHGRVKNGAGIPWNVTGQQLNSKIEGNDLLLDAAAKSVKPDRDLALEMVDPSAESAGSMVRFNSAKHEGIQYLMLRYRPNLASPKQVQRRDWVFLFESSADRDPLLARAQIEVIRTLLNNAGHEDTFAIVRAGTHASDNGDPKPVTPENVRAALEAIEKAHLIGALDLGKGLEAAVKRTKGLANPTLVHLGSGIAALGERNDNVLVKKLPENVCYVGVGVGKRWSRNFMKAAAERSGGAFVQINPDEPIGWRAFELFSLINTPRLMNARVIDNQEKVQFLSYASTVAQGEELCAIARIDPEKEMPQSVTIDGTFEGQPFRQVVPVAEVVPGADYLPRTWAKLEIDRLLTQDQEKNKKTIIDLSKQMYVMTSFTSLLVLENEGMYKQFKVDRGRKDHWAMYDCPPKVPIVYKPDPSQGTDWRFRPQVAPVQTQKPSAEQVLQSILVRMPPQFYRAPNGIQVVTAYQLKTASFALGELEDVTAAAPMFGGRSGATRESMLFGRGEGKGGGQGQFRGFRSPMAGLPAVNGLQQMQLKAAAPMIDNGRSANRRRSDRGLQVDRLRRLQPMASERAQRMEQLEEAIPAFRDLQEFSKRVQEADGKRARAGDFKKLVEDKVSAEDILDRLIRGYMLASLVYQRPGFGGDERTFYDLLTYSPGMNTTSADILGTVDAEAAPEPSQAPGAVAPKAAKLIEQARGAGWQTVLVPANGGQPAFTVIFDGQGRYAYQRVLPEGLKERVVCDGKTLWHFYPELGVAAKRNVGRFHRAEFAVIVPWALPTVEDLARGTDITCVDERTVRITPHPSADKKDAKTVATELVFANGRLAERRSVELPSGKTLGRESYTAAGNVEVIDAKGKIVSDSNFALETAEEAPGLEPDTAAYLVLALPYRTQQQVWQAFGIKNWDFRNIKEEAAQALIGTFYLQSNPWQAYQIYNQHYHAKGRKLVGMAVLFAATSNHFAFNGAGNLGSLLAGHQDKPIAKYLGVASDPQRRGSNMVGDTGAAKGSFLHELAAFRDLYVHWQSNKPLRDKAERERALRYVREHASSAYGWAILGMVHERDGNGPDVAEAYLLFEKCPGLEYAARYEYARCSGDGTVFLDLYEKTLASGTLPAIDADFRKVFLHDDNPNWPIFGDVIRKAAAMFLAQNRRDTVIHLAGQCRQLGDSLLADDLLALALKNVPTEERLAISLAAIEHLVQSNQLKRAEDLMQSLLQDKNLNENASLWHLAASLAGRQRVTIRSVEYLDKALDLEFRQLPAVVNLQQIRSDYGRLLNAYQQVVSAMTFVEMPVPEKFVGKVVRAADRWRSVDPENAQPCQQASRLLKQLGQKDLAWEYLTTPSARHPNEAQPHLQMAQALLGEGEFDLADKAYAAAFQAEPTNAQILWDRAQALQQAGRVMEARQVYRKLADGQWQPRFRWIQQQARYQLGIR